MEANLQKIMDSVRVGQEVGMEPASLLGQSLTAHLKRANLEALVIHHRPKGWTADVLLKDLPVGLPNTLGTPESMPMKTREEAVQAGAALVKVIALQIKENDLSQGQAPMADKRYFQIEGFELSMPAAAIEALSRSLDDILSIMPTAVEDTFERLRYNIHELTGGQPLTAGHLENASDEMTERLRANMGVLLAFGHAKYSRPEFRDPEPNGTGDGGPEM